ncbi:MAG: hypothetical protein OXH53_10335 [bacterium]|nr:hypothetical protein [bacterium]MCY3631127.1 hypothetical protein [bacterium]
MKENKETNKETKGNTSQGMRVIHGDNSEPDNSTGRCLAFAEAARQLGMAARGQGLTVPSFRSPPREVGRRRTLARHSDGSVTVAVMVRNRHWVAVLADMIEGVVVANQMAGIAAEALRDQLWEALEGESAQREAA